MLDAQLRDLIEKRRAAPKVIVEYSDATGDLIATEAEGEYTAAAIIAFKVTEDFGPFLAAAGSFPFEELAAERERLRAALERTLGNFERVLARKSVRDATETIAEARAALQEVTE